MDAKQFVNTKARVAFTSTDKDACLIFGLDDGQLFPVVDALNSLKREGRISNVTVLFADKDMDNTIAFTTNLVHLSARMDSVIVTCKDDTRWYFDAKHIDVRML